jgi:hypothetical protein
MTPQMVTAIGEVLVSLVALGIGGWLVGFSGSPGGETAGAGVMSAVVVFWFQRRASESATAAVTNLASGKADQTHADVGQLSSNVASMGVKVDRLVQAAVPQTSLAPVIHAGGAGGTPR